MVDEVKKPGHLQDPCWVSHNFLPGVFQCQCQLVSLEQQQLSLGGDPVLSPRLTGSRTHPGPQGLSPESWGHAPRVASLGHGAGTQHPLFLGSPTSSCCSWSTGPPCALCCKASSRSASCLQSTASQKVSGVQGVRPAPRPTQSRHPPRASLRLHAQHPGPSVFLVTNHHPQLMPIIWGCGDDQMNMVQ